MTNKELQELLKEYPDDMEIELSTEYGLSPIKDIHPVMHEIKKNVTYTVIALFAD